MNDDILKKRCKEFGEHNYELFSRVKQMGEFGDWVCTIGFYSVLHFVSMAIFPFSQDGMKMDTYEKYFIEYKRKAKANFSTQKYERHYLLQNLVYDKLKEIAPQYEYLLSASKNARYTQYKLNPKQVTRAIRNVEEIKKFCENK